MNNEEAIQMVLTEEEYSEYKQTDKYIYSYW